MLRANFNKFASFCVRVSSLHIATFASMILSMITVPIFSRFLDPAIWGSAQLATRVMDMGHGVTLPGISESALQSSAKDKHGNLAILLHKKRHFGVIVGSTIVLIGFIYCLAGEVTAGTMIIIGGVAFPLIAPGSGIPDAWMEGLGSIRTLAQLRLARAGLSLFGLLGVALAPNSALFYLAPVCGMCIYSIISQRCALSNRRNSIEDENLIEMGRRMTSGRVIGTILLSLEFVTISLILGVGMEGVAGWVAGTALANYFKAMLANTQAVLSKNIYSEQNLSAKLHYLLPWTRAWFAFSLIAGIGAYLWGETVLHVILGNGWDTPAKIGAVILGATLVISVTDIYSAILLSEGDIFYNNFFQIATGAANAVLILIGAMYFGLWGVCVAKLVNMAIGTIIRFSFMLKKMTSVSLSTK